MINNPFGELDDMMKRMGDQRIKRIYGMNPEMFYNLPYEIQKELVHNCWRIIDAHHKESNGDLREMPEKHNTKLDNFRKRLALRQYNFEEELKEKVLSLIKKK